MTTNYVFGLFVREKVRRKNLNGIKSDGKFCL